MRVIEAGDELPTVAANVLVSALRQLLTQGSRVSVALSGGRTPWPALTQLAAANLPWNRIDIYQVDERIAPAGDPARNLVGLQTALGPEAAGRLIPMPVEAGDLGAAAARYADELPATLDLVHLGLGDDGHTASLVPGDPALDVMSRTVALTEPYRGHRRMTLTLPALNEARQIVWIVGGSDKAEMTRRLRGGDSTIPAGRVRQDRATLILGAGLGGADGMFASP